MPRVARSDAPDAVWHMTGRVNWRVWHLQSDEAASIYFGCLRQALRFFSMDLLAFVLMSNHYHLVLRDPPPERFRELTTRRTRCRHHRPWPRSDFRSSVISQFARELKLKVARILQEELNLTGHLWQGPHYRRRVLDTRDLIVTVAYDHRNPLRQGMVLRPEEYARSSAAWWTGGGSTRVPLMLRGELPFGASLGEFRERLRRFQESRRLDDVMAAFLKSNRRLDTPGGRARFERLLEEAGLDELWCGSAAAVHRS